MAFARLQSLSEVLNQSSEPISAISQSFTASDEPIVEEQAVSAKDIEQKYRQLAESEVANYSADVKSRGVARQSPAGKSDDVPLLSYWEASQHKFPIVYRIALDILPAQASSVPCEGIFFLQQRHSYIEAGKSLPCSNDHPSDSQIFLSS
ncbi:hypothetical protein FRC02_003675 [Tulasnella sp. 418]|nr:hypothetical protein FRC02_003675 [Tulasnella sp. 418]